MSKTKVPARLVSSEALTHRRLVSLRVLSWTFLCACPCPNHTSYKDTSHIG